MGSKIFLRWIWLALTLFLSSTRGQNGALSINRPRNRGGEDPEKPGGGNPVLVKLPEDLEAVLNLQKNDRSRIHASILGLNPENEHLDQVRVRLILDDSLFFQR